MRQGIEAAVNNDAQYGDDGKETEQARHRAVLALIPLVPVNGSEYDHVRRELTSIRQIDPDVPAMGYTDYWDRPRLQTY